jgi:hypothetical protein
LVRQFHGTEYDVVVSGEENSLTINSDRVKCLVCGIYPSYVAGILKHVVEINLYVLLMTN